MLTSIRIQNFRSIRDAQVMLGQVNLFIGPNNSGKSNFLKALILGSDIIQEFPAPHSVEQEEYLSLVYRLTTTKNQAPILFSFREDDKEFVVQIGQLTSIVRQGLNPVETHVTLFANAEVIDLISALDNGLVPDSVEEGLYMIKEKIANLGSYDINPIFSHYNRKLSQEDYFATDGSNIVPFLFTLSQNHKGLFRELESGLANCVGSIVSIGTPADPDEEGKLKLKLFDKNDIGYWAEEVSEGVIYFLSLLCIVYQPNPPSILLLEEPEKGIHPRRIREVMDFIFELARLRGIQIILTSHSPYVVDHFADIPECISVFDRENGETVIRNAADIIAETNATLKEPIRYSDALGEHWVSGFLGGVPR